MGTLILTVMVRRLFCLWLLLEIAAASSEQCPTKIFSDRGMTKKDFTAHHNIASVAECCALCASLRNSTSTPCLAFTYHSRARQCETAPYATVVYGKGKQSGSFQPPPSPPPAPSPPPHPPSGFQPNLVLILQDDQDLYMGGWTPMKQTIEKVNKRGATAENWFIHTPVCCPSRGELLSGRYFHNIRMPTPHNKGCMHIDEDKVNPVSFAKYLGDAGYTTGYFGKHMNNCPQSPPAGFTCDTCKWFAYGGDTAKAKNCSNWLPNGRGCKGGGYYDAAFFDWEGGKPVSGAGSNNPAPGYYQADRDGEYSGYSASIVANK